MLTNTFSCHISSLCVRVDGGECYELEEKWHLLAVANAPLLLGSASHHAWGVANQLRVNLKPLPGVFQGQFKYLLWSRDSVRPRNGSCKWSFGRGSCSEDTQITTIFQLWKMSNVLPTVHEVNSTKMRYIPHFLSSCILKWSTLQARPTKYLN